VVSSDGISMYGVSSDGIKESMASNAVALLKLLVQQKIFQPVSNDENSD